MALGKDSITAATGWFAIFCGWLTCTIPALLLLSGSFVSTATTAWTGALIFAASFAASLFLGRSRQKSEADQVGPATTQGAAS